MPKQLINIKNPEYPTSSTQKRVLAILDSSDGKVQVAKGSKILQLSQELEPHIPKRTMMEDPQRLGK